MLKMSRCAAALIVAVVCVATVARAERPNVLFIAVDDLRPELACYGAAHIHSPNIDRLAASGVRFDRAYCMVPTCGASRAALMTGLRPRRDRFVNYLTRADKDAPGITTMNTHFLLQGYYTVSLGKVFHHTADNKDGWSEPPWRAKVPQQYHLPENQQIVRQRTARGDRRPRAAPYEAADAPDDAYADGLLAAQAVGMLERLSRREEPFFLAVGFMKPHLPFVCPQTYWDLYDPAEIRLPETYHRPESAPDEAIHNSGELRAYHGIPRQGPVSEETARNLIRGYYACVSFTDAQVGKVLASVDKLGLRENTIVVLWGDHGWNLGEHTLWCKHSCFETSMRIPLIIRGPGITADAATDALVESIDLYPTLCEAAGISLPPHLQGESLLSLLKDPSQPGKAAAIGRYSNGDTIRTKQFRYTEYSSKKGIVRATMLYDHTADAAEDHNIVEMPLVQSLIPKLKQQLMRTERIE